MALALASSRFQDYGPVEHLIGEPGQGFNIARILVVAANIGSACWALDTAIEWARERTVFGEPLASGQAVAFRLADLYTELEQPGY